MNLLLDLSLLFILSLVGTGLLTKLLIKHLAYLGVVDTPGTRRAHKKVTPRGGGLALVAVFILGFVASEYFITHSIVKSMQLIPIFSVIATISFIDDLRPISASIRLLVHLGCSAVAVYMFLFPNTLFNHELPHYVDFILAVICLTAFLNIYNFLDGIDGITASQSIHLSMCILLLCYLKSDVIINVNFIQFVATIILAWSIGFLMFNWHPALIFPGDVGSISLGFLTGLCLLLIAASGERLFASASIMSLYYITDGGLTILIRLVKGEKIWQPHLQHFFQKAVKNGYSHKQVVMRIILCNAFLMLLAINALYSPVTSIILAILVVMITLTNFAK